MSQIKQRASMLAHATCVAIAGKGVLITGGSGSGKSDLALRLIDAGAALVSDDQVEITAVGDKLLASPPPAIAGYMELRHIGIIRLPYSSEVPLELCVELANLNEKIDRLAEDDGFCISGILLRRIRLPGFAASTPAKIRMAVLDPSVLSPIEHFPAGLKQPL